MRNSGVIGKAKRYISSNYIFRLPLSVWFGTKFSFHNFVSKVFAPYITILKTGEFSNFTYDLAPSNLIYLAETIAVVTNQKTEDIARYIREPLEDGDLLSHIEAAMRRGIRKGAKQSVRMPFGRRLGWYAIVRAMKPKVVVETGVERGHGAILLCAALLRNKQEGAEGRYFGTDINPEAGWLLGGKYAVHGEMLYGDSLESLKNFPYTIDLFINDSDHSSNYEEAEYEAVRERLSKGAIILGDNAHVTDKLALFARQTGRQFLFFKEQPQGHWYPGGGIGIAFRNINMPINL